MTNCASFFNLTYVGRHAKMSKKEKTFSQIRHFHVSRLSPRRFLFFFWAVLPLPTPLTKSVRSKAEANTIAYSWPLDKQNKAVAFFSSSFFFQQ